ncbi:hypothetical protein J132_04496 [Termitomyces sp. J132]|nr:hypothetical protein J132_04496 [Termitomyces sp. J132]
METIEPTRRHPSYRPAFSFHIPPSKETALTAIQRAHDKSRTLVYCDGLGFEGGIGASAVLYIDGEEVTSLRYHLSSAAEHTVYEGEVVGFTLGLHLLSTLNQQLRGPTIMGSDSQAVIKALKNQRPHPAHHLLDKAHSAAEALHRKQGHLIHTTQRHAVQGTGREKDLHSWGVIKLQVHWAPGHLDFGPNERADELAKEAAMGSSSPPHDLPVYLRTKPLPTSTTAVRQADLVASQVIWKRRWKKSMRSPFIRLLDRTLPSRSYLRLVSDLDRRRSALLTQLRMGHLPLNHHLFHIRRSESPTCPYCQGITVETVAHFLFQCPQYKHERHIHLVRPLKCKAESISLLLSSPAALKHLFRFAEATKQFPSSIDPAAQSTSTPPPLRLTALPPTRSR